MQQINSKHIIGTPFRVTTESIANAPGTWNSTKVSIYRDENYDIHSNVYRDGKLIGEYLRNYSAHGHDTFCPFQIGDHWYALYSASYTATRVMKLYEDRIEDWCGEEKSANGFCPVEMYVPRYIISEHTLNIQGKDSTYKSIYTDCDYSTEEFLEELNSKDFQSIDYCNFGFLAGCVWGDDTTWKLRYIDLSKVPDKILTITDKFGYWELPDLPLRECIKMDNWAPGRSYICVYKQQDIDLNENIG